MSADKMKTMVAVGPYKPRGRGRPRLLPEEARRHAPLLRPDQSAGLQYLAERDGKSESELFRQAIDLLFKREGVPVAPAH